jgi:hypothetical protein
MNTKILFSFFITHPDAGLRFSEFDQNDQPMLNYWQAVGAVFSQMLEQMDDQDLATALERHAIAREGLYEAASNGHGLTVLATAQSALETFLAKELGDDVEVEIAYA